MAQRIRHLTTNQGIPSSNPGVVEVLFFFPSDPFAFNRVQSFSPPFPFFSDSCQLFERLLVVGASRKLDHRPQTELEQGGVSHLN